MLQAVVALPVMTLLLRVRGYARTAEAVGARARRVAASDGAEPVPLDVRVVTSAVTTVAGRRADRGDCLPRALTIAWLSARRGHRVDVVFGVAQPQSTTLSGHAWAEHAGRPVNDTEDVRTRYTVFDLADIHQKNHWDSNPPADI